MSIEVSPDKHVLIAGPTASGKSSLALQIAAAQGGLIINADALQVYGGWRILTARPSQEDEAKAPHELYGHIAPDQPYSVGDWLKEVKQRLTNRLIIVGGTGLYFSALTEGLANIPPLPEQVRTEGNALSLSQLLDQLDEPTRSKIDVANRARVQRAWEVLRATGTSLADWQKRTPPPLIDGKDATALLLKAPKDWLNPRIEQRFDIMLDQGMLDEARSMLPKWNPVDPASKAIGAAELISHLKGEMDLSLTREKIIVATRQYAKRQRTWFNKRMRDWDQIDLSSTDLSTALRL